LTLMVNPEGSATLEAKVNGQVILTQSFDSEPKRARQEDISGSHLNSARNTLTVIKTAGTGDLHLSDSKVVYKALWVRSKR